MTKPSVTPTSQNDILALSDVLDATELFPSHMLPDMIDAFLAGQSDEIWLTCALEDHPVGLCYTVPETLAEGTWNMLALAVHPSVQGRGFGATLVQAVEQKLKERGARILIVDTSGTDEFARTRAFYTQNAYEEEARIRDFWAPGDDKVIFRKAL